MTQSLQAKGYIYGQLRSNSQADNSIASWRIGIKCSRAKILGSLILSLPSSKQAIVYSFTQNLKSSLNFCNNLLHIDKKFINSKPINYSLLQTNHVCQIEGSNTIRLCLIAYLQVLKSDADHYIVCPDLRFCRAPFSTLNDLNICTSH